MRGKIGMETNKALVLNEKRTSIFFFFPFLFCSKQICFIENQVCSHHTGLQSPGNVITVRFLPQDEDWWPTLQSGQKKNGRARDLQKNERQTLLGLRLAAHTHTHKKKILQNLPKKLASNDAEDLLCSLFLYFLSFFFLLYVYVVCIFKNITFF